VLNCEKMSLCNKKYILTHFRTKSMDLGPKLHTSQIEVSSSPPGQGKPSLVTLYSKVTCYPIHNTRSKSRAPGLSMSILPAFPHISKAGRKVGTEISWKVRKECWGWMKHVYEDFKSLPCKIKWPVTLFLLAVHSCTLQKFTATAFLPT